MRGQRERVLNGRRAPARRLGRRAVLSVVAGVFAMAPAVPAAGQETAEQAAAVRRYVDGHRAEIVSDLVDLLAIPNVAADSADIRRNAALIRRMMEARGIETRLIETGGSPAVYGELPVEGAKRTLLIYAHYDGQPVDSTKWTGTTPFAPVLRKGTLESAPEPVPLPAQSDAYDPEWRIYARSASDDKAPIVSMLHALDALRAAGLKPSMNVKFLFEGEEEAGSPNLESAVRANADLLRADVAIVADGPVYPSNAPTVSFGARGIASAQITVYGPVHPLHSGHYGNWAPNPAERLAELLATMQDSTGAVTIPGWYDDVVPPGPPEQAAFRALAAMPEEEAERKALGVAAPEGGGRSRWEMVMRPSLNVDGLRSGWVGAESRTIIPDVAIASLDMRLVPNVEPGAQIRRLVAHVEAQGYTVIDRDPDLDTRLAHPKLAKVTSSGGYPAVRTPLDDPAARGLIAALHAAAGADLVVIPTMGGSVPGYIFPRYLHATFVGLPIVNPDNNQHSPNENVRLGNLFRGVELFAAALRADLPSTGPASDDR